jgi:hypothetical protein
MEFKLLETVLKDATLDLGFEGGVMNGHVYQDWRHNLAQAQADFPGAPAEKRLLSPFFSTKHGETFAAHYPERLLLITLIGMKFAHVTKCLNWRKTWCM